jgi:Holliday junction resolvase RusA-like endonuclease
MPSYWLPLPPSTNNLFITLRGGRRRVISPGYRAWRAEAEAAMLAHHPIETIEDPVEIAMVIDPRNRMDLDNTIKAPIDHIVRAGVIPNDKPKHVKKITIQEGPAAGGVIVAVKRIGAQQ